MGADRKSLALQFLAEALVLTLLALFISVGLAEFLLSLQPMVDFLGSPLDIDLDENSGQLLLLTIAGIFLGLLSGSYPAFYFSSIPPAEAFKPQSVAANRSSLPLRSSLLTLQMLLSITVLAGAFIMLTQVNYLEDRPLGFDKENKLAVKLGLSPDPSGIRPFMNQLREHPGITQVTMANLLPGTPGLEPEAMIERNNGENASFKLNWIRVDENYLPTMGIDLVAGNNFDATQLESGNPIQPFLVNQTLVDAMAWDMPIGKEIYLPGWNITGRVSGVFRDYHFLDLHQELALLLLSPIYPKDRFGRSIILNVLPGNLQEVLAFIDAKLQEFRPGPLVYSFIDQELSARYVTEQRQMKMVAGFSCVSILIACIGLLGLSAFTIEQRTKEIGIRKTLGASTLRIIAMLFKPVLGLIPSASLLAAGIAYLTMDEWLENFAYRVDISPLIFVAASGVVVLLAFLTMGSQAYRIARENPVNALRYE